MISLNQAEDLSSELFMFARNLPLLHKLPGNRLGLDLRLPFGHSKRAARFCLKISYAENRDNSVFSF